MNFLYIVKLRLGIFYELFSFLWNKKHWWLIPLVMVLILLAGIIVFLQTSAIAPFVYPLI